MATKSVGAPRAAPQMTLPGFAEQTDGNRHRLFFALVPNAAVRNEISRAAGQLRDAQHPHGSWIAPERYHVTLRFLGDYSQLPPDLVDRAAMAATKVRAPVFDAVFDSASSFRGSSPPWVLRCPEPAESIQRLWQALGVALAGERVRSDSSSAFTPHITLLRDADKPLAPCAIGPIVWRVRDFVLIHSQIGRERRYTELERWSLADAANPP